MLLRKYWFKVQDYVTHESKVVHAVAESHEEALRVAVDSSNWSVRQCRITYANVERDPFLDDGDPLV